MGWGVFVLAMSKGIIGGPGEGYKPLPSKKSVPLLSRGGSTVLVVKERKAVDCGTPTWMGNVDLIPSKPMDYMTYFIARIRESH